jgi:hypothetical protein
MPVEKFKDLTIRDHKFQLRRVTSDVGQWIIIQIVGGKSSELAVYRQIRNYMFESLSVYKDVGGSLVPLKAFAEGRWLDPSLDLEYDLELHDALYDALLDFNLGDFLKKLVEKSKAEKEAVLLSATIPASNQ